MSVGEQIWQILKIVNEQWGWFRCRLNDAIYRKQGGGLWSDLPNSHHPERVSLNCPHELD